MRGIVMRGIDGFDYEIREYDDEFEITCLTPMGGTRTVAKCIYKEDAERLLILILAHGLTRRD